MIAWLKRHRPRPVLLAAAGLLAGCAAQAPGPDPKAGEIRAMMVIGITDIHEVYIDEIAPERLAEKALGGVVALDPALTLERADDAIRLRRDAAPVASLPVPQGRAPAVWGGVAADLILAARTGSPVLRDADTEALYDAAFGEMTALLDRFSRYAGRDAARLNRAEREGFGGIGVTVQSHPEGARVTAVDPRTPAAAAGLIVDDIIVEIDGAAVSGLSLGAVVARLRGPVDRSVRLGLRRAGLDLVQRVEVGRTRIVPNTVDLTVDGDIATLRVSAFNRLTAKRLSEAIARAETIARPALNGLILDLRGNLGGVLDQAIAAADLVLDAGIILETYGRHPQSRQHFEAEPGDLAAGRPIAVLIDGATASSAEILASALQDNDRAVLVGSMSFGKGTVQTVLPLSPNDGELVLTWAEFVAPSGYALDRVGVLPHICTSGATDPAGVLARALAGQAIAIRRAFAMRRATDNKDPLARGRAAALCPWQPTTTDTAVDEIVAARLLRNRGLFETVLAASRPPPA